MNVYLEAFSRYLQEHPLKMYDIEVESVLELFYECYAEGALRDTPEMKACIRRVYELTSPRVGDELLYLISDFALAGEKRAFLEGFRAGGKWAMEMADNPCKDKKIMV